MLPRNCYVNAGVVVIFLAPARGTEHVQIYFGTGRVQSASSISSGILVRNLGDVAPGERILGDVTYNQQQGSTTGE